VLYVIAPVPGPIRNGAPRNISIRPIASARYLERSQIVRSSEGYRMDVLANDWWGEPFDAMLSRILAQELSQRLPGSLVFGDNGAITTKPDATVEVNLQRFDLDRSGAVLLMAQIATDAQRPLSQSVTFTVRPTDATTAALVGAMSTATGEMADTIAAMLTG
jgi:uncharacterized lipoprotein YmbA